MGNSSIDFFSAYFSASKEKIKYVLSVNSGRLRVAVKKGIIVILIYEIIKCNYVYLVYYATYLFIPIHTIPEVH